MLLVNAFAIVAQLCLLTLAADCAEGTCSNDVTSLVQLKQVVKHGSERDPDAEEDVQLEEAELVDGATEKEKLPIPFTPDVDWKAEVDSMPAGIDVGSVTAAYENNIDKVRDIIVEKTADSLAFDEKVRAERRANKKAAEEEAAVIPLAVEAALKADKEKVHEVVASRKAAVDEAVWRVKRAKANAEAHAIKKSQAETAALEGRVAGANEGVREAHRQRVHARQVAAAAAAQRVREKERIAEERGIAAGRAAIDRQTEVKADNQQAWVHQQARRAKIIEQQADARAHVAETYIEGAEGMKNTLTDHAAARDVRHFNRHTESAQERIDAAASGAWPAGFEPAAP